MSALFERMATPCHLRTLVNNAWSNGDALNAAIVKDSSFEARIAEKQTGKATYTVTADRALGYHDVIRRDSDNQVYRITSKAVDSKPPAEASFSFWQVQAEMWEEMT